MKNGEISKGLPQELELQVLQSSSSSILKKTTVPQVKLDVNYENGMGISLVPFKRR